MLKIGRGGLRPGAFGRKNTSTQNNSKNDQDIIQILHNGGSHQSSTMNVPLLSNFVLYTQNQRLQYYLDNKVSVGLAKYIEDVITGTDKKEQKIQHALWPYEADLELFRIHYLRRQHIEWQENAAREIKQAIKSGYKTILVQAPKRHGKSTLITDFLTQHIVFNKNDPCKYITKASALAKEKISPVKERFEYDRKLSEDLGPFKSPNAKWATEAFTIIRSAYREDPTLEALGLDSAYTGKNCRFMIVDDPVDAKMSADNMRAAHDKIFGEAMNTLEPGAICIFIMTRKAPDDIEASLLGKCPFCEHNHSQGVKVIDYGKAIIEGDFQHTGPDTYELVRDEQDKIRDIVIHGKYKTLAPDLGWDIRELIKKYYEVGEAFFLREYQNDPSALEGKRFKTDWYNYYDEFRFQDTADCIRYITVDLALSDNPASDYSAIVGMGHDIIHDRYYVDKTYIMHKPLDEVFIQLVEYADEFKPINILVEAVAAFGPLTKDWANATHWPIDYIKYIQTGKQERITGAIQPALMNKKLWFKREHQDLITELKNFPLSERDHIVDAVAQLIIRLNEEGESWGDTEAF